MSLAALVCCSGCEPLTESSSSQSTESDGDPGVAETVPDDWESFVDESQGVSFRYPRNLETAYIRALDWPPQAAVHAGPFTCTEAGAETARAGRTEPTEVDGRTYCVTRVTEGAAGSVYTMYAYAMQAEDDVVILTFSVRAVQCGNYDEPDRSACERERMAFSMDPIVDRIARTVRVNPSATVP